MLGSRFLQLSAGRLLASRGFHASSSLMGGHGPPGDLYWAHEKAQGRDYVGFGVNGSPAYADRFDYPYPSIRFKKNDAEILALREKEKGDWKKLTVEEKKKLYRASFCATMAEMDAPKGHWKVIVGGVAFLIGTALWVSFGIRKFVYNELPHSTSMEWKEAMLQRMIDLRQESVTGYASKWDYEKGRWKA